jgi:nucleoside-diphosphate-sugar epimerase
MWPVGKALVLGGTGQIGRAAVQRLADEGWDVTIAARREPPAELTEFRFVRLDRTLPGELEAVVDGVDVLVDVVPFTLNDGRQLASLAGRVGSVIAISSAAVYGWSDLPIPIPESHQTVEPGDAGYASRKRAIEMMLLDASDLRATILRPGAVHGRGSPHPREWYFVKRVLDGRRVIVLAHRGESRFQTTSVANLAELIALAARQPGMRVLNCGDPDPPHVLEIARVIGGALRHEWTEVLMPGAEKGGVGDHPWNVAAPFVLDMSEATRQLGYSPPTTYEEAVQDTIEWVVAATSGRDWRTAIRDSEHLEPMFDYPAEDAYLAGLQRD